jgi:hypothetical protein
MHNAMGLYLVLCKKICKNLVFGAKTEKPITNGKKERFCWKDFGKRVRINSTEFSSFSIILNFRPDFSVPEGLKSSKGNPSLGVLYKKDGMLPKYTGYIPCK